MTPRRYVIQQGDAYFVRINAQHMVASFGAARDARAWRTKRGAEQFIRHYGDAGYGLRVATARVLLVGDDLIAGGQRTGQGSRPSNTTWQAEVTRGLRRPRSERGAARGAEPSASVGCLRSAAVTTRR